MAGSDARARAIEETVDREFVVSRVFDAPRELVFEAWTEAKHMARCWGLRSMTNPVCAMDGCAAGKWLSHHDARCQRGRLPDQRIFSRGVEAGAIGDEHGLFGASQKWHDMVCPKHSVGDTNPVAEILRSVTFEEDDGWSQSFDKLTELLVMGGEKS
jgi:hypothetical protein